MRSHTYLVGAQHRYETFGNTFKTTMFDVTLFNTIEPKNIKTVLSDCFKDYSIGERRKDAFRPLLEDGIFNSDGTIWAHSRKLIRPTLVISREMQIAVFAKHVDNLIRAVPRDGKVVDLQKLFFELTLDTASDILFGRSCSLLTKPVDNLEATAFAEAFSSVQSTLVTHLCLGKLAKIVPEPVFKSHLHYLHTFVDKVIHDHRQSLEDPTKLPTEARHILQSLDEEIHDPVKLRGQLMSLLVGGRDTTASLLSNLWFVLARRPDIWAKLQLEVGQLNGQKPDCHLLKGMKYLRYCLNECEQLTRSINPKILTKVQQLSAFILQFQ